ncbi:MAG: double-strand break repair protein AddB, partial [Pseudomonadota bacterium]
AVAAHPAGAIVLPGLDTHLDAASFAAIRPADSARHHTEHPQYGLAGVLAGLDADRNAVVQLELQPAEVAALRDASDLRAKVLSEAMRPADTTDRWSTFSAHVTASDIEDALDGVALIEAPTALDEAEVAALILREALETPGRTAALVSPDRLLARRVAARLKTWQIDVDDSAGRPLRKTPPGSLVENVLAVGEADFAAAPLAALLKHPLTRLGLAAGPVRQAARNLELTALRSSDMSPGLHGLRDAVNIAYDAVGSGAGPRQSRAVRLMKDKPDDWAAMLDLIDRLEQAFAPLATLAQTSGPQPLHALVDALAQTVEAVAAPPRPAPDAASNDAPQDTTASSATEVASPVWQGEDGEVAAQIFARLLDPDLVAPETSAQAFPELFRALTARETVRQTARVHPRLAIWGPYEARLQMPDIVILGGLNDGTWPTVGETGPWLNRPMRDLVGFPQPEVEIGRAAHDFTALCSAPSVYLTRAEKVDGAPTVPSRWLLRLQTVLASCGAQGALKAKLPWRAWALARHATGPAFPVDPPAPRPAVTLRPKQLSVTDIGTWIANPYALFAAKILQLEPLDPIGIQPDAKMRGTLVHDVLGRFAARHPDTLPADIAGVLMALANEVMADASVHPTVRAFWLPRFARFADWFAETERERRAGVARTISEVVGAMAITASGASLKLTARADRIDCRADGGIAIYDYKGGGSATLSTLARDARTLHAPQLPLEAAIAAAGGFNGVPAPDVINKLAYISTQGGNPPGSEIALTGDKAPPASEQGAAAQAALEALVERYADPDTPYRATRRANFDYRYDAFEQLARVREWSATDTGDAADGGEAAA